MRTALQWTQTLVWPALIIGIFCFVRQEIKEAIRSGLLQSLAWPAVVLFAFLYLRKELKQIVSRLNTAKIGPAEFRLLDAGIAKRLETEQSNQSAKHSKLEYKILNTLFTKQVNKWPNYGTVWTFWVGPGSEYADYREAKGRLLTEKLIGETGDSNDSIFLTTKGFDYCKKHYKEFPPDQWWPEEQIDRSNLEKVLRGELGPKQ